MIITLPFPPSYNRYWRATRNGNYISAEGKQFKAAAADALARLSVVQLEGAVSVRMRFYRPRKSGDLDNRFKQVLDALQGTAYANDSQIVEIHAMRFEDKSNPRVEVEIMQAETNE